MTESESKPPEAKKRRFVQIPPEFWESGACHLFSVAEREVYQYLRYRRRNSPKRDRFNQAWPGQKRIAKDLNMHEKSVSRAISSLVAMGTIYIIKKGWKAPDGTSHPTIYGFTEPFTFDLSKQKRQKPRKAKAAKAPAAGIVAPDAHSVAPLDAHYLAHPENVG